MATESQGEGAADRPLISVVIPVYRSAEVLEALHARLTKTLDEITEAWEILFVEDASPDDAWRKLEAFAERDPRVRAIQLMRNYGQQRAILCGLAHSTGRYVVTMDDDLQHRPEEIPVLLEAIESSDADVVVGRYHEKKHGPIRRMGTRIVKWLAQRIVGVPPTLSLTSFRIVRHEVAHEVSRIQHANPVVGYLLFSVTRRFENVDVHHDARASGSSNYGFLDLLDYFMCMVIDYSDWPLRAVGGCGFFLSLGSFGIGAYYLYRYFAGMVGVDGFTTLVLLLTFLSGFVLIGIGIIGSYLLRVLRRDGPDSRVAIRMRRDGA